MSETKKSQAGSVVLALALVVAVSVLLFSQLGSFGAPAEPVEWPFVFEQPEPEPGPPLAELELFELTGQFPKTLAGQHAEWAVQQINLQCLTTTIESVEARFEPELLANIPADALVADLCRLGHEYAPYALVGFREEPTERSLKAVFAIRNGHYQVLEVSIEEGSDLLTVLWFSNWL